MFSRSIHGLALARRVLVSRAPQAQTLTLTLTPTPTPTLHATPQMRFQRAALATTSVSRADRTQPEAPPEKPEKPNYQYDPMCSPFEQRIVQEYGEKWRQNAPLTMVTKMKKLRVKRAQWQQHLSDGSPFPPPKPAKQQPTDDDDVDQDRHWSRRRREWLLHALRNNSLEDVLQWARQKDAEPSVQAASQKKQKATARWLLRVHELHRDDWVNVFTDNIRVFLNPKRHSGGTAKAAQYAKYRRSMAAKSIKALTAASSASVAGGEGSAADTSEAEGVAPEQTETAHRDAPRAEAELVPEPEASSEDAAYALGPQEAALTNEAEDIPAGPVLSDETGAATTKSENGQEPEPSLAEAAHADPPAGIVVEPAQTPESDSVKDAQPAADENEAPKDEQAKETAAPSGRGKS